MISKILYVLGLLLRLKLRNLKITKCGIVVNLNKDLICSVNTESYSSVHRSPSHRLLAVNILFGGCISDVNICGKTDYSSVVTCIRSVSTCTVESNVSLLWSITHLPSRGILTDKPLGVIASELPWITSFVDVHIWESRWVVRSVNACSSNCHFCKIPLVKRGCCFRQICQKELECND